PSTLIDVSLLWPCRFFYSDLLDHRQRYTLFPYTTLFRSGKFSRDARRSAPLRVAAKLSFVFSVSSVTLWLVPLPTDLRGASARADRKSTRLNSSHDQISYAVFCLKKKILIFSTISTTASN